MILKIRIDKLLIASIIAVLASTSFFLAILLQNSKDITEVKASSYSVEQVITAINKKRRDLNLPELLSNPQLGIAAQAKADHMVQYQYFSHIHSESGRKWSDFIKESGYEYTVAGENLANGFYEVDTMVQAWMDSPSHRKNIVNETVDETGVGIAVGTLNDRQTIFVVQVFGKQDKSTMNKSI